MSNSQAGQEVWVLNMLKNKREGFFVEVGAYDGIESSNTYMLEKYWGWQGICIEANQNVFHQLYVNRKTKNINYAVTDHTGMLEFAGDRIGPGAMVKCDTLNNILTKCEAPEEIDYISMDIEGHELTVLQSFDFDKWKVNLWTIEHNIYSDGPEKKDAIFKLMSEKGYERVVEDAKVTQEGMFFNQPFEDWYALKNLKV